MMDSEIDTYIAAADEIPSDDVVGKMLLGLLYRGENGVSHGMLCDEYRAAVFKRLYRCLESSYFFGYVNDILLVKRNKRTIYGK